jgi:hypothetical protein
MAPILAEPPTGSNYACSPIVVWAELKSSYMYTQRVTYARDVILVRRTVSLLDLPAHPLLLSSVVAIGEISAILTLFSSDTMRRVQLISLTASVAIFLLSTSSSLATPTIPTRGGVLVLLRECATQTAAENFWDC